MIRKKRLLSIALCLCLICTILPAPTRADGAGSNSWISGTTVRAQMTGTTSFNIMGLDGSKDYQTTFRNAGYRTAASVDGGRLQDNAGRLLAPGLKLDVRLERWENNFIKVIYTLSNNGAKAHTVKLGSHADVMIDRNDRAPIYATEQGGNRLSMSGASINNYAFKLIADSCSTIWYGFYRNRTENCFTDMKDRGPGNTYQGDSGLAYAWNISISPGGTWTSYVLIGTGSPDQMNNITIPPIPQPKPVIPQPSIALSTNDVYFTEGDGDPLPSDWRTYISSSEGKVTITGMPTNRQTPGNYSVVYTASNSNGTTSKTLTVHILPKPAELSRTTADLKAGTETFTLSATMNQTGGLRWMETGFVYGALQNPTLTLKDGSVTTTPAVSTKNGRLTASVTNLTAGIAYYARAYARASDGTVIYGSQSVGFGLGAPSYGVFSVTNSGSSNTFTIERTDGTDGKQTVYYRTVNGSAIGGTHFTHAARSVVFAKGESTKTVTVTEKNVTTPFSRDKPATAYSNADRTYQLEIYRVDGGATIDANKNTAMRTMTVDNTYRVDRNTYSTEKSKVDITKTSGTNGRQIADTERDKGGKDTNVSFITNRFSPNYKNYRNDVNLSNYYTANLSQYLQHTCSAWFYRYEMYAYEQEDGWEHAYIGSQALEDKHYKTSGSGAAVSDLPGQLWACTFEHINNSSPQYRFPDQTTGGKGSGKPSKIGRPSYVTTKGGKGYVQLGVNDRCYIYFGANGSKSDIWWINGLTSYVLPQDTAGPKLLGVAPMAGSYRPGDKLTLALVFDEIVDKQNSTNAGLSNTVSIPVSFEKTGISNKVNFSYSGGMDTNVLYFTGTIPETLSGDCKVRVQMSAWTDKTKVRDMCNNQASGKESFDGNLSISTTAKPTVKILSLTNKYGTLTGSITATNADKLEYAWTQTAKVPTSGWRLLPQTAPSTVTTRQTSGTWYLHVRATNTDGQTATTYKYVTIPTSGTDTYAAPELTVRVDNTKWARTRPITVTCSPSTATVTVKPPGGTETRVSGKTYTANTEGIYTFTLTSGSGSNAETVTRQAVVSKLDKTPPVITIHDLPSTPGTSYTERVSLNFSVADSGSGVKSVTAKWNDTTITPKRNADGTYTVTCPDTAGNVSGRFTVTAKDSLGNSASKDSNTYTMNLKAPTLTVGEASSTQKGVTYSYRVIANGNNDIVVHLPDGTETGVLSGSFTLTEAGTYAIIVTDLAGHFVSENLTVSGKVDGTPPEVRLYPDESSETGNLQVAVGVYEKGSTPTVKLGSTVLAMDNKGDGIYSSSFTVTAGDTYTVAARDTAGNSAEASIIVYALVDDISKTLKLAVDGTYGTLPEPAAKHGYTFDGWYTQKVGGTKVTSGRPDRTGYTLYAHWTATISVDITWSALDFTYSDGTWNPENHAYENGGWVTNTSDGNQIRVENKGVTDVKVIFSYTQKNPAVSGSFADNVGKPITSPVRLSTTEARDARLTLKGKPNENLKSAEIGTVTITLGGD